MTLRRINENEGIIKWPRSEECNHPEHNPPGMTVLPDGLYEHSCPECGKRAVFRVDEADISSDLKRGFVSMIDHDHITRLLRSLDLLPDSNVVIQGGSGPKYAGLTVGQLKWLLHERAGKAADALVAREHGKGGGK